VRNVKTDDEFRKLLKHHAEVRAAGERAACMREAVRGLRARARAKAWRDAPC
jgi:hypothetical protein